MKCANAIAVWVRKARGSSGSSRIALFKLSIAPSASPTYPRTQPLRSQAVARLTSSSSARLVSHKARSTSLKKKACTCPAQARATGSSAPISVAESTSRAISFSSKFDSQLLTLAKKWQDAANHKASSSRDPCRSPHRNTGAPLNSPPLSSDSNWQGRADTSRRHRDRRLRGA